jgi:thiol-disulfide isomerase/thioredoxin
VYRTSFFIVILSILVVGVLSMGSRFVGAIPGMSVLPSSYDPKIGVAEAARMSDKPLLIEFYTDTCQTCQVITPWVHKLSKKYRDDMTFIMVNADDPLQRDVVTIFAIEYVPAIFVFDFNKMTKAQIDPDSYRNEHTLDQAIGNALQTVESKPARNPASS